MCIAVAIPPGKKFSYDTAKICFDQNRDGAGFAHNDIDTGKVVISKGFFSFKPFWKEFIKTRIANQQSSFMVHFRISTSGKVDLDNCHPFYVYDDETLAFCHNGVLSKMPTVKGKNDTRVFLDIMRGLPGKFHRNMSTMVMMKLAITPSKFVFLEGTGEFIILNKSLGVVDKGVWYSNTTYKPATVTTYACDYRWSKPYEKCPECTHGELISAEQIKVKKCWACIEGYPTHCTICNRILYSTERYRGTCYLCVGKNK